MNGNEKKKKRMGGAYPGQRPPQHQPYTPPATDFGKDGQATAHFVAHGGGNALVLVRKDGSSQPESGGHGGGGGKPQYISGTCACRHSMFHVLLFLLATFFLYFLLTETPPTLFHLGHDVCIM